MYFCHTKQSTSKIHYCIGSLNVVVAPRVQHFSAFHCISNYAMVIAIAVTIIIVQGGIFFLIFIRYSFSFVL